jgi:hypothetical protein
VRDDGRLRAARVGPHTPGPRIGRRRSAPYGVAGDQLRRRPERLPPARAEGSHALDAVCDVANAILPDGTKLHGNSQCHAFFAAHEQARDAGWVARGKLRIEWYGIATAADEGDGRWRPCVQATGPFAGYFVAQTAMPADPSKGRCDPARYIDSTRLSFVVVPGSSEFLKRGVGPGSVGAAYYAKTGRTVPTIVGDVGPRRELGKARSR